MSDEFDFDFEAPKVKRTITKEVIAKKPVPKKAAAPAVPAKKTVGVRKTAATASGASDKPKAPPLPKFDAPEDFKRALYLVHLSFDAAGMVDPTTWKVERVQGRLDSPKVKIQDIEDFDRVTSLGLISRLSAIMFQTNYMKRMELTPEGRQYILTVAAGMNKEGQITTSVKALQYLTPKGTIRPIEDKTTPIYRRFRRSSRFLPSAFVGAVQPPRLRAPRSKKVTEDESED